MKHYSHRLWKKFRHVHPVIFLVIALLWIAIAVFALRANNQHMIELRKDVYSADEQNGDVQSKLRELQNYVTRHMNTDLSSAGGTTVYPPVQLKYTYDRLVKAQGDAVNDANSKLYSTAQAYCEQQNSTDVSGRNRIPCIEQYVQQHTTAETPQISDALYKFAFVSPKWSPDFAGWSLVIAAVSVPVFLTSLGASLVARRMHKRSAAKL